MALLDMLRGKQKDAPKAAKKVVKKLKIVKKTVKVVKIRHNVSQKSKPKQAPKAVSARPAPQAPKPVAPPKLADEKAWELLRDARIPVAPYMFVKREVDLSIALKKTGIPAVLKVSGPSIVHKTEFGGVKTGIVTTEQAAQVFAGLMKIRGAEKVHVQKQLAGIELIVGAKADPQFGAIVSVGLGGIYVELLKDVAFRVAPVSPEDAQAMLRELRGFDLLTGARGQPPVKLESLVDVIVKVGRLALAQKIREMDINPLICNSEGCWAADVRVVK